MADQSSSPGNLNRTPFGVTAPAYAHLTLPGQPVYISGEYEVDLANADAIGTAVVIGLAPFGVQPDERAPVKNGGSLQLTTDQWDAIAGTTGGLTPGTTYYLSDSADGHITDTAPSATNHYVVSVGTAFSATDLFVQIGTPINNLGV